MASIEFSASLNTAQLEAAIKQSNATVKDWAQSVEKAGGQADQSFDKVAKTVERTSEQQKNAINEQKAFIKGLIDEIKNLERAAKAAHDTATDTTAGIAKQNAMSVSREAQQELASAQNQLIQEKETLNRLQNETISQNKEEETSQGKIIESLKKWGMGLLTITGAIKAFKAIIASSNALTEEFGFTVDGAKGALQQFFQVFSAGAGQTGNPIANMIKGFKGSKELAQNIDLYNDSMRANLVLNAQEIETLKQKEAIFRNASDSPGNTAKRKAALEEWIVIRKEAAARELKIEQDLNTSLLNEIKNRPNLKGITDQEIGGFVTMYAKNPQLMQKAEELSKIYSGMAEWDTADKIAKLRKEIDALLPSGVTFESLMSSIRLNSALSDKQIDALAVSYKNLATAQGAGAAVEAESARWLGSIINKGEDAEKKLNDIKVQIDTLTISLATANDAERKGIALTIVALKEKLAVQEKIVRQAIEAAQFEGIPISSIATSGIKVPSVLPKTKKPSTQKQWDDLQKEMTSLRPISKESVNAGKEADKLSIEAGKLKIENQKQLISGAQDLIYMAGQKLGLDEDELKVLDEKLQVIGQFASGNIVGAAVTAVISVVSSFMALIPGEYSKLDRQIEHINQLLEEQQRLIDLSQRAGGESSARQGEVDLLKEQLAAQEAKLKKAQDYLDPSFKFRSNSKDKTAIKTVEEMTLAIKETQNAIDEADQDLTDFLVGGITENTIADSIAQGFRDSKTSVDDFADYMNTVLLDAVMNIFKGNILDSPLMKDYMGYVTQTLSDGVLSQDDIDILNKKGKELSDSMKPTWDALSGGLDIMGGAANTGLSGQIARSITEETGTEWVGLARRQADDLRVVKDYSIIGVAHLVGIEANTYNTVVELKNAVIELKTISSNTKQVPVGAL